VDPRDFLTNKTEGKRLYPMLKMSFITHLAYYPWQ